MEREPSEGLISKKVLIGLAVVVFLVVAGRCGLSYMFTSGEAHSAQERVRRMLDGMKQGGNRQQAIALWKLGSFNIPGGIEAFSAAADEFDAWEAENELVGLSQYEITGAEVTAETGKLGEATVVVSGTIDGRPFKFKVVQGQAVEWIP
jgi:hypothetical protein